MDSGRWRKASGSEVMRDESAEVLEAQYEMVLDAVCDENGGVEHAAVLVVEKRGEREQQRGAHGWQGHQRGRAVQGDSGRGEQHVVEKLGSVGHEKWTAVAHRTLEKVPAVGTGAR